VFSENTMSALVVQRLLCFLIDLFFMHGLRVDVGLHATLKHLSKNSSSKAQDLNFNLTLSDYSQPIDNELQCRHRRIIWHVGLYIYMYIYTYIYCIWKEEKFGCLCTDTILHCRLIKKN
jgi:hypothetical protein